MEDNVGVSILLFVVICSGDLLYCEDRSEPIQFEDNTACAAAKRNVLARSLADARHGVVVMAKCQYVLRTPNQSAVRDILPSAVELGQMRVDRPDDLPISPLQLPQSFEGLEQVTTLGHAR